MDGTENLRAFVQRYQLPLIAAGIVLIAAALTAAYFTWFHQTYAVLFRDLRTMDAATIVAELDKRKVPYHLKDGGQTILVPEKLVDTTRLAIMSQELPLKGVVGFELFSKSDMGLTEFAQRINYRRALQGEIARTIMALETVESARVHLSLSEASVFREDRKPAKASVTIIPRGGRALSPLSIRGVQRLVAAAVPDLDPGDVVILDAGGAVVSSAETAQAATPAPDVQQQAAIEGYYAGRIRKALRSLLPDDEVTVTVVAGWSRSDGAPDTAGDPFGDWSPATRRFPLAVEVATASPVGPQVQQQIQALAAQTIGRRPDIGDDVRVAIAAPRPAPPAAVPQPQASPPAPLPASTEPASPALDTWIWFAAPGLVALLAGAVVLHRRSLRPRRLTRRERDSYADELRKLLEEGEGNAIAGR
jgi:flagellar M-ring protein FliF